MDLSTYVRVGRYDLPEPTRTTAPSGNLLAQEASGVTYNWDTNTLFVVGDGGTSVTQVSLTGQLINTMTLAAGGSPQGTDFYDTEGITYVGGGQFVFTEERYRQLDKFTYAAGTTLSHSGAQTVDLGTDIGNTGLEGLTYDPLTGGFVVVKEAGPEGIFQTTLDFANGTASNGSPSTTNSTNLFDPTDAGLNDMSDVYALSSNGSFVGTSEEGNLLILSQESGKIVEVDRDGHILSSLTLQAPPTSSGIDLQAMTVEGITMDAAGNIYLVSEEGGGDFDHPQLWVYAPTSGTNTAPTAISLVNPTTSILENTSTSTHVKVADLAVTDDGLGTNTYTVTGADAAYFEADASGLYIKAGTVLDYETKTSYNVTVNVDDTSVGATPDASTNYSLSVTNVVNEGGASAGVRITEVAPWSSGNSPSNVASDWFELTNVGSGTVSLTGWKMDDDSYSSGSAVALNGVSSLAPGESAIFIETSSSSVVSAFRTLWNVPANVKIGTYSGSGVGLSTGGDAVNVFNGSNVLQASVTFGSSSSSAPYRTFDNAAGLNSTSTSSHVTISTLASAGNNGAYAINPSTGQEVGSPGTVGGVPAPVNHAPTAIGLTGEITSLAENTNTASHVKVASIIVTDDGLGTNNLTVSGADAAYFEADSTGLYLKAGTVLDYETKGSYNVTVNVDDPTLGATPDASVNFSLTLTDVPETSVRITEVAPWSSGNSPVAADWFEVTNTGATAVDITGWKMDDNSNSFANAVALSGITSIAPGESVIFLESGSAAIKDAFLSNWFGGNIPAGLQVGTYSGGGVGLSTGGDAVNLYNAGGVLQASVSFGASPAGPSFPTFDNSAGLNNVAIPTLSAAGTNAAFHAVNDTSEIGSPGENSPVNNAPTGVDDAVTGLVEDGSGVASGNVLANDTDADIAQAQGETLQVTGARTGTEAAGGSFTTLSGATVIDGAYGQLTISADGSYSYALDNSRPAVDTLAEGQHVADTFSYQLTDSHGVTDVAQISVDITGANDGPLFTSPSAFTVEENQSTAAALTAVDPDAGTTLVYTITGGADAALFDIDEATGAITFKTAPDFETPADAGGDNVYDIDVAVGDGGLVGEASLTITVTNVNDNLTGTAGADILTGTPGNDLLSGLAGNDTINGLGGNDTIDGGLGNDVLDGGDGIDTLSYADGKAVKVDLSLETLQNTGLGGGKDIILHFENLIGSNYADQLTGNDVANHIDGGLGADKLWGFGDADTLIGNEGNDQIWGGDGADSLDGGLGADKLYGEAGTDVLLGGDGADQLFGGDAADSLDGGLGNDKLYGEDGADTLLGGDGVDQLDGGTGADILNGGIGNDKYWVDDAGDQVIEASVIDGGTGKEIGGVDWVYSTVSYALTDNVEKLTLEDGAGDINGTGNGLNNTIFGNDGANILNGGAGKDVIEGGAGADTFVFDVLTTTALKDTVKDFVSGEDKIEISISAFTGLAGYGLGTLDSGELAFGAKATTAGQHLIYNSNGGALFYDADGQGGAAQVQIAALTGHPTLNASDVVLIG